MKKTGIIILMAAIMLSALAGCGKPEKRELYNLNLKKYVELGDYKDIPVDTSSDTFKEVYDEVIDSDISSNGLYAKKTEGKVQKGDTANIDYVGKLNGTAFEGGTANGSDLEIGSGSFIDGFEDGLIDKEIGSTVDLNLTFPEGYQNTELAGKDVVFTVKINYVKTTTPLTPEEYFGELSYETLTDYTDNVKERAIKNYLVDAVVANSKLKKYSEDDIESLYASTKNMMENSLKNQYGVDFATYLSSQNMTEEAFKEDVIKNDIKPSMDTQCVFYAIFDNEKCTVTGNDVKKRIEDDVKEYANSNITYQTLVDFYGNAYYESLIVSDKVINLIYDSAKIK